MQGGHEFFSSLFGEFLVGRDCSSVLQDPNADQMDREVCSSLLQFQEQLRGGHLTDGQVLPLDAPLGDTDPQSLRDEILHRQSGSRWPHSHHRLQPDKDLDGQVTGDDLWGRDWLEHGDGNLKQDHQHYSSSTVIVTRRPDGRYEEKRISKDSNGREETTTRIMDNNHETFFKRLFGSKKT